MNLYVCGQKAFGAAVFQMCVQEKYSVVGVSAPLTSSRDPRRPDRLRAAADAAGIPVLPAGMLNAETLPEDVDLILAAHSHDFIGRKTRLRAGIGAIGYHPSLLPLHRGRDSVRWAIKMGDKVAGGTIYWLSDTVDAGDMAAQDYCFIEPYEVAEDLWRDKLFPMGVRLFARVLRDIPTGHMRREAAAAGFYESKTWGKQYPRLQLLTIAELLDGRRVDMPPIRQVGATFKKAKRAHKKDEQLELPASGKAPASPVQYP